MKKLIYFIIIYTFLINLSSCIITQEIHFNEDFSGTYSFTYDYSEYINFFNNTETADSLMISNQDFEEMLKETEAELKKVYGLDKIEFGNDTVNGSICFSFQFADISSLNESLKLSSVYHDDVTFSGAIYFELDRKKLYFKRKPIDLSKNADIDTDDMFNNVLKISFEKKPRRIYIADKNVKIQNDGKLIIEEGKLIDISTKEADWEFCFRKYFCFY
jgi:hypothetical protein